MKWPMRQLKEVAPAEPSSIRFSPEDVVWHLTLDQIESDTGFIIEKKNAPASKAGTSTFVFDDGNVLYSKLRPYLNKVVCPSESGIGTTELVPLRPRPDVLDRRFLTYYLRSKHFWAFANIAVAGVKMPRIIMAKFWEHHIPVPPLSEQRRIVEILDKADALRKKRVEADSRAARILPALFYRMFGDPITNPMGWPIRYLGDPDVAEINPRFDGETPPPETDFSFVPMSDVDEKWGRIVGSKCRPFAEVSRGYTVFKDRDILFAKITPCMQNGKIAIATGLRNGYGFGSTEFHVLRAGAMTTPEWLYCLVRLEVFRRQAEASFTGSAGQQRVPVDFLKRYRIPCPPLELQHRFAVAVQDILNRANQVDKTKNKIERIFQNLLHNAFTGDLTAQWREAQMKELLVEMEAQAKALKS